MKFDNEEDDDCGKGLNNKKEKKLVKNANGSINKEKMKNLVNEDNERKENPKNGKKENSLKNFKNGNVKNEKNPNSSQNSNPNHEKELNDSIHKLQQINKDLSSKNVNKDLPKKENNENNENNQSNSNPDQNKVPTTIIKKIKHINHNHNELINQIGVLSSKVNSLDHTIKSFKAQSDEAKPVIKRTNTRKTTEKEYVHHTRVPSKTSTISYSLKK